jgi:hypothetical protein
VVVSFAPRPQEGHTSPALLIDTGGNTYPLQVVEGSWQVQEAQRFGDKIAVGPISYQDFNPYESATVSARFHGGYGLRRYSDWTGQDDAYTHVLESSNVDTSHDIAILSPVRHAETLPGSTAPVIWLGEVAGVLTAVCAFTGRCIYQRIAGVWVRAAGSTAGTPLQGAVGYFNNTLILGYGGGAIAQYTTDAGASFSNLVDDSANNLYAYAVTVDHAAAYIAGGAVNDLGTAFHGQAQAISSSDGHTFQRASIVKCGDPNTAITALAPGGGIATLYIGKSTELGQVNKSNVYDVLIPFETRLGRNCVGMRWWLSRGADEQRGPAVLVVPRDGQVWLYAPSNQNTGQAQNMTPWANPDIRPPNARGDTWAVLGTSRWLYSAITNPTTGNTYILKRDARTGATSIYLDIGVAGCQAFYYSTTVDTNPVLMYGAGVGVSWVKLPRSGEWPLDDANADYAAVGTLDLPEIDLGFVGEPKIEFSVQVVADGLSTTQQVQIQYALDGGSYSILGTAQVSPVTDILFPDPRPAARVLGLRATLTTTDSTKTPQVRAIVVRQSLNAKLYRLWVFQARTPAGAQSLGDDLINPYTFQKALWALRTAGVPVIFVDRWGDRYQVRLLELGEQESYREPDRVPETVMGLKLLEVAGVAAALTSEVFALGAWANFWFPMGFPGNNLGPSVLSGSTSVANTSGATTYPSWTVKGPGKWLTLQNVVTPYGGAPQPVQIFVLNHELVAGETVSINFDPSRHTVVNQDGVDLSGGVSGTYWGLGTGGNAVTIQMSGATTASQITLTRPV